MDLNDEQAASINTSTLILAGPRNLSKTTALDIYIFYAVVAQKAILCCTFI